MRGVTLYVDRRAYTLMREWDFIPFQTHMGCAGGFEVDGYDLSIGEAEFAMRMVKRYGYYADYGAHLI